MGFFLYLVSYLAFAGVDEANLYQEADPYEIQFQQAMEYINQGAYFSSAQLLINLNELTNSPRVKLELARTLYLMGKKKESEILFNDVLHQNPPMMVRERINVFLEDIALSAGKIDATFGVVYDTNPRAVTSDRVINLFGFPFNYDPGASTKPQFGLGYTFNVSKGLDDSNKWVAGVSVNGARFDNSIFDRTTLEQSLSYRLSEAPKIVVKLAYEEFLYGEKLLYSTPSISFKNTVSYDNGSYWNTDFKFAEMHYSNSYQYLNGSIYSATIAYGHPVFENAILSLDIGLDKAQSKESHYSYHAKSVGFTSIFLYPDYFLKGQIKAIVANRTYEDSDPIFGLTRNDNRYGIYFNLIKTDFDLFGMTPSLDVSYEKNESNINIYSYNRQIIGFTLKKVF